MAVVLEPISNSELKTFQRCEKQWEYKYDQRLEPRLKSRPLYLGSWGHLALQTHYSDGDWRIGHNAYVADYNKLFEEERIALETKRGKRGEPLPSIIERIMRSYVWYRRHENLTVVAIEKKFEIETPLKINGQHQPFDGIIDLIVEDEDGNKWVVDHKFVSTIPEAGAYHAMDPQLILYPWAAKIAWGMDIAGIMYNYVLSKPPSIPQLTKKTQQISRRKVKTDYPTLKRFLKENGFDPADFSEALSPLRKKSPFLRRYKLHRTSHVTREIVLDLLSVAKRTRGDTTRRTRSITRDCARQCSFHNLCRAELEGRDTTLMRNKDFTIRKGRRDLLGDGIDEELEEGEE